MENAMVPGAVGLLVGAGLALVAGWRLFWFLTDDAFITFRYVSNSQLGYGYVWNPAPFRAVEGYSSFLWMVMLDGVWRIFGVEPPVTSCYLSLLFSFCALAVTTVFALTLRWRDRLRTYRFGLVGLALLGLVTNRTFLTWSSSGLETALFNLLVLVWLFACARPRPASTAWRAALATSATGLYLTRPDGILFAAATVLLLVACGIVERDHGVRPWLAALPLLAIPLHVMWRLHRYGEWLPNTYYAKVRGIWPASGLRYLASFLLEYGLWFWLVAMVWLAVRARLWQRARAAWRAAEVWAGSERAGLPAALAQVAGVGTLVVQLLYYVVVVGGDHFEYRVLSHLIAPALVAFLWMLNAAAVRGRIACVLMVVLLLLGLPLPWSHWALSHRLETRPATYHMKVAVAPHWPAGVRWYAELFDRLQFWLIDHWVCVRHQEHKVFWQWYSGLFPTRVQGSQLPP
ncbi:MAG TPA: hypothetical protein VFG86_20520, partial [Chloroflexota bacterium]|nr:hypothetical protein [Chloroflexota bacterium]